MVLSKLFFVMASRSLIQYPSTRTNSENCHFVNHLCAYQRYDNIPELFTFLSKLGNIEAIFSSLVKNVNNSGMLLYL